MIEKILLDYLTENLSVPVYLEVPINPPKTFVIFEKVGSSEENHLKKSMLAIQSYAETLYKSVVLNENVKEVMKEFIELDSIAKSKLNGDYNFTDTETKQYRYQCLYEVTHY